MSDSPPKRMTQEERERLFEVTAAQRAADEFYSLALGDYEELSPEGRERADQIRQLVGEEAIACAKALKEENEMLEEKRSLAEGKAALVGELRAKNERLETILARIGSDDFLALALEDDENLSDEDKAMARYLRKVIGDPALAEIKRMFAATERLKREINEEVRRNRKNLKVRLEKAKVALEAAAPVLDAAVRSLLVPPGDANLAWDLVSDALVTIAETEEEAEGRRRLARKG